MTSQGPKVVFKGMSDEQFAQFQIYEKAFFSWDYLGLDKKWREAAERGRAMKDRKSITLEQFKRLFPVYL